MKTDRGTSFDNAQAAMEDIDYRQGMAAYNREVASRMDPIWEAGYRNGSRPETPRPDSSVEEGG